MLEFEVLDHYESPIGVLILRQRNPPENDVFELTLEHEFLMSSAVTFSERALATRAIELHGGSDLSVLVGGLGLGYTCKAALESPRVAHVECIELVAGVIRWIERGMVPLGKELMAEPRLHISQGDVYAQLCDAPTVQYDIILIDVDHSPDERLHESSASFYGRERLALARRHLKPGGVFAVWSTSPAPWFEDELSAAFDGYKVESIDFFNPTTRRDETNWLFFAH